MNKVILIGRLGGDPKRFYQRNGDPYALCQLATEHTNRQGEKIVSWHNVALFGAAAPVLLQHGAKGRLLLFEGSLQYYETTDAATGTPIKREQVVCRSFEFLGARPKKDDHPDPSDGPDDVVLEDDMPF